MPTKTIYIEARNMRDLQTIAKELEITVSKLINLICKEYLKQSK
jgi:hypothetical protein